MKNERPGFTAVLAAALLLAGPASSGAQDITVQQIELDGDGGLVSFDNTIRAYESVEYLISGEASQVLSVDMLTSNVSAVFFVERVGQNIRIFNGSLNGNIANVALPESGDYVIRVFLVRAAARRNETADYSLTVSLGPPEFADGLAGGPDFWAVTGVGGSELNLRQGPSTRYAVIGSLNNGDVLENRGCRLTGQDRWCRIRISNSGVAGWVAGRYLVETTPPDTP